MSAILALAAKDLRVLLRVKAGLFFTFIWPLAIAVLFGAVFTSSGEHGPRGIAVAIADEDQSARSREFAASAGAGDALAIRSCTRREAIELVRRGKVVAGIVLPQGFGAANLFRGDPPRAEVWIDPSRKAESAIVQGLLFQRAARQLQAKMAVQWQPLRIEGHDIAIASEGPRSGYQITFPQGLVWGVLGCGMTFAVGFVSERTAGTLLRLRMAPIERFHLLAGKALACAAACVLIQALLCAIGRFACGLVPYSWPLLALAGLASLAAFVGIMMLVAGLGKTEQAAGGVGWALMMPLALFGGAMIPLPFLPAWMARIGMLSPVRWSILAYEGAIWRGFSFQEMLLPCGILFAMGAVCFAIGVRTLRLN